MHCRNLKLTTIIIFIATSLIVAQDTRPLDITSGQPLQTANGKPLLEYWHQPDLLGGVDKPTAYDIHMISNKELLFQTDAKYLSVISIKGEILSVMQAYESTFRVKNEKIYGLKSHYIDLISTKEADVFVHIYNKHLRQEASVKLRGIPRSTFLDDFCITDAGNYVLLVNEIGSESENPLQFYIFASDGKLQHKLPVPEDIKSIRGVVAADNNSFIVFCPFDKKAVRYSLNGEKLLEFSLELNSVELPFSSIKSTPEGNILLSYSSWPDVFTVEIDQKGDLVKRTFFSLPDNKEMQGCYAAVKMPNGSFFISFGSDPQNHVRKFTRGGKASRQIFPFNKKYLPKAVNDAVRPENINDISQGPGQTLLALSNIDKTIYNINANGKVLSSFNVDKDLAIIRILLNSKGEIVALTKEKLLFYSIKGELVRTVVFPNNPYNSRAAYEMKQDKKGNIFVLRSSWNSGEKHVSIFDQEGTPLKEVIKSDGQKYYYDFAVDAQSNIYLITDENTVNKYNKRGKFLTSYEIPRNYHSIDIGPSGRIYLASLLNSAFNIYDSSFNLISWNNSELGLDQPSKILEAKNGKLYASGYGIPAVINNYIEYKGDFETATITGIVKPLKGEAVETRQTVRAVYLEGYDPDGIFFTAVAPINDSRRYSFTNIPIGSKITIWAESPRSDLLKMKKPFQSFTVTKTSYTRNFRYGLFKPDQLLVRGRVVRNSGVPLAGVKVFAGKERAVTNRFGHFFLPADPNKTISVKVEKAGMAFDSPERTVKLKERDFFYLDFEEK